MAWNPYLNVKTLLLWRGAGLGLGRVVREVRPVIGPLMKRNQSNWSRIFKERLKLRAQMLQILEKILREKGLNLFARIWTCPETQKF
jgi:hypothetical protein